LDARVLNAIVAQALGAAVSISAVGGETSLGSVASWLEERSRSPKKDGTLGPPTEAAFAVQDRNYRPQEEAEATWSDPGTTRLIWRRHEIENYLLEPRIVLAAFDSFRQTIREDWVRVLPSNAEQVLHLLARLARPMIPGHTGGVLHWELRAAVGQAGNTDVALPKPVPQTGLTYAGRDQWVEAFCAEAERLARDCEAVAALPQLRPDSIRARYDDLLAGATDPSFILSGDFLLDMGGKELLSAVTQYVRALGATALSSEDFQEELVVAVAREYREGLFEPDDFAHLAQRLRAAG
jgi:hypothetical protein